jgi:hypothetical protein
MQKSQYLGFFANCLLPIKRIRGANGPRKGAAHSSQRGGLGSFPHTARRARGAGSVPFK